MFVALGSASAGAGNTGTEGQLSQLAPNGAPGIVTTAALGDLPDGLAIAVTPFADDHLSLSIKSRFEAALRAAHRPVSDMAPLTANLGRSVTGQPFDIE